MLRTHFLSQVGLAALITLVGGEVCWANGDVVYSSKCAACHGVDGLAPMPNAPNLVGQKKGYVMTQLADFKSGERKGLMMPAISAGLTEEEMEAVAAFIAEGMVCK